MAEAGVILDGAPEHARHVGRRPFYAGAVLKPLAAFGVQEKAGTRSKPALESVGGTGLDREGGDLDDHG